MFKSKFDNRGCVEIDKEATHLFLIQCVKRGWKATKATKKQDMFEHWDWEISKDRESMLIDIKGLKRINSKDKTQDDSKIWLEYENVNGDPGWLQGKADFIAFLTNEGFIFVNRTKLLEHSWKLVNWAQPPKESVRDKKIHTVYQRSQWGRKDVIAMITKEELLSLPHATWEI